MLDLLLRILDNIKQLIELKDKRQDTIFEKLIEPIFNDLQIVHQDYLETLGQLHDLLPCKTDKADLYRRKIKKAEEFLTARSIKLEPVRERLRAYGDLQKATGKVTDLDRFLNGVLDYLSWGIPDINFQASFYRTWIEQLQQIGFQLKEIEKSRKLGLARLEELIFLHDDDISIPKGIEAVTYWSGRLTLGKARSLQGECVAQKEEMRQRWSRVSTVFADIKVKTVSR